MVYLHFVVSLFELLFTFTLCLAYCYLVSLFYVLSSIFLSSLISHPCHFVSSSISDGPRIGSWSEGRDLVRGSIFGPRVDFRVWSWPGVHFGPFGGPFWALLGVNYSLLNPPILDPFSGPVRYPLMVCHFGPSHQLKPVRVFVFLDPFFVTS